MARRGRITPEVWARNGPFLEELGRLQRYRLAGPACGAVRSRRTIGA
eukprot:COSAG06_NODE_1699_length_8682_cov_4.914269_1_plen_46_part_10